jgi:hypothetical protein
MPRKILLTAALTVFYTVFVMGQSTNQPSSAPANGPFGGPLLVTPTASLPTPAPTAGISNAGRAGFSSLGVSSPTPGETTVPSTEYVNPSAENVNAAPEASVPPATPNPNEEQPRNDLSPSVFVNGASEIAAPVSVAQASIRYKGEKNTHNTRVLSDEDVQKMLSGKSGVTMAKNMPPLGQGALEQSGQPQNGGTQTAATQNPSQPAPQGTQDSATANQGQNAPGTQPSANQSSETSADNTTTPQINQNQQSNDAQGGHRLPATATFLPLLGLLGLASGGIGLWFRKFRR